VGVLRVKGFSGENRALHPSLLPDSIGTISLNQKPGRGDLRPWKSPSTVATVPSGRGTIYRMGRDVASDTNYWLSWPGAVHVVRGANSSDTLERTYYTGDGAPKVTNTTLGLSSAPYPTAYRTLGVPAPTSAPTVAIATTGDHTGLTASDVYYVYTFVTDYDEESAPSPASAKVVKFTTDTVTVSAFASAPSGSYVIDKIRVYRTQTGSASTEFYFLREITIATTSTTDDNRALAEVLETGAWLPPPADLKYLTPMWGGMIAGISGRGVRICEPSVYYAWPIANEYVPSDYTPVALGSYGQNLVVLTNGSPMILAGVSPDSMDEMPVDFMQACVAPASVVSMGHGVVWASPDGLAYVGASGPRLLTDGVMTREDWQAINPSTIIACMYEGRYIASYEQTAGVRKGFVFDPANPAGFYFLDFGFDAAYTDDLQDALYLLIGTDIRKWDSGTALTTKFRSKLFRSSRPIPTFACAEVMADSYPVTFRLYADGTLRHTETVTAQNPFRLPGGFYAQSFQIEIESTNPVQSAAVAHSMEEIAEV